MSASSLLEEMVLVAILNGADTIDALEEALKVSREDLEAALTSLEAKGLVKPERKGIVFKKTVYRLTGRGLEEAKKALERVKKLAREVSEKLREARLEEAEPERVRSVLGDQLYSLLPLLAWLGLLELPLLMYTAYTLGEASGEGEEVYEEYLEEDLDTAF